MLTRRHAAARRHAAPTRSSVARMALDALRAVFVPQLRAPGRHAAFPPAGLSGLWA